jgi:hypothetical protein
MKDGPQEPHVSFKPSGSSGSGLPPDLPRHQRDDQRSGILGVFGHFRDDGFQCNHGEMFQLLLLADTFAVAPVHSITVFGSN